MPYCTAAEVKYLVHTDLSDEAVGALITLADADLDQMLGGAALSDNLKKLCSMLLTAIHVARRDPEATTVGSARIQYGSRIKDWKARVDELVFRATGSRFKVKSSGYQKIDEDTRYPEDG